MAHPNRPVVALMGDGAAVTDDNLRGVHINGSDYVGLASLFDGHDERLTDPAQLCAALSEA